jgi:hypothetical protein
VNGVRRHFGGWAPQLAEMTGTCPLESFGPRLAQVDAACCVEVRRQPAAPWG